MSLKSESTKREHHQIRFKVERCASKSSFSISSSLFLHSSIKREICSCALHTQYRKSIRCYPKVTRPCFSSIAMETIPDWLISDETFVEPATTGEFLPNGRKRYQEWSKRRREEIHQQLTGFGGVSIDGHNPVTSILMSSDDFSPSFKNELIQIDLQAKGIMNELLKTTEVFPSKYLVGSDDKESTIQDAKRTLHATALTRKPRKSRLFPSNQPRSIHPDQIMVPTNASGIVNVVERRIHIDRLINRNASLYSMLRAWILGDPDVESISPIATIASQGVRRKTLEDYIKQEQVKEKLIEPKEKLIEQKDFSKSFRRLGSLKAKRLKPSKRLHKFYSAQKEIRKRYKPDSTKRPWNHLHKKRAAAAKQSLRRKGIKI